VRPNARGLFAVLLALFSTRACLEAGEGRPTIDPKDVIERFTFNKDKNLILLPVTIRGKQYRFLLDTGSDLNVFDSSLLWDRRKGWCWLKTPSGSVAVDLFKPPTARVGKLPNDGPELVVGLDLSDFREAAGEEFHGILGRAFLQHYIVHIGFDRGEVLFLRNLPRYPGRFMPMRFQKGGPPTVEVKFKGEKINWHFQFGLDTGMVGHAACIKSALFEELIELDMLAVTGESTSQDPAGRHTHTCGSVESLAVAGFTQYDLGVVKGNANILGLNYLARFVVTFDFPEKALYLHKGKKFDLPEGDNQSGLHVVRAGGKLVVRSVSESSPAGTAGLKPKDVLLKIDTRSADQLTFAALKRLLNCEGRTLQLTVGRGEERLGLKLKLPARKEKQAAPPAPSKPAPKATPPAGRDENKTPTEPPTFREPTGGGRRDPRHRDD
jgi:hypothetical protein